MGSEFNSMNSYVYKRAKRPVGGSLFCMEIKAESKPILNPQNNTTA